MAFFLLLNAAAIFLHNYRFVFETANGKAFPIVKVCFLLKEKHSLFELDFQLFRAASIFSGVTGRNPPFTQKLLQGV